MPLFQGESKQGNPREYMFVAIDGSSRELYAALLLDKSQFSSVLFLDDVIEQCPYTIDYMYSDNGNELKGTEHMLLSNAAPKVILDRILRVLQGLKPMVKPNV